MPSFTRRTPSTAQPPPPGSHPSPSSPTLFLLPTGLPSLDDILGGGLPLGSVLLVLAPDGHSAWARLVARYFAAQGLASGQDLLVLGDEGVGRDVVEGCMWMEKGSGYGSGGGNPDGGGGSESEGEREADSTTGGVGSEDAKRIAWRYQGMAKYKTTVGGNGNHTAPLSLTTSVPPDILRQAESSRQLQYISLADGQHGYDEQQQLAGPSHGHRPARRASKWERALIQLKEKLDEADKKRAGRVVVHELGSLDWADDHDEMACSHIHRFLHSLRTLVRPTSTSAIVTVPSDLVPSLARRSGRSAEELIRQLSWGVDACVELKGFADDPTLPTLFPTTHGLLTLHSFPTSHTLLPSTLKYSTLLGVAASSASSSSSTSAGAGSAAAGGGGGGGGGAGENNLGFKLKRKKFVLETVHLGVEGGVGERRTEMPSTGVQDVLSGSGTGPPSISQVEGVEKPQLKPEVDVDVADLGGGVKSAGNADAGGKKERKPRARVRFGEEEVVLVDRADEQRAQHHHHQHGPHDHAHDHAHGHGHEHGQHDQDRTVPRVAIRHDRPDLYDF